MQTPRRDSVAPQHGAPARPAPPTLVAGGDLALAGRTDQSILWYMALLIEVVLLTAACGDMRTVVELAPAEDSPELCVDGLDNDEDGHTDCADQDCQVLVACLSGDHEADTSEDSQGGPRRRPRGRVSVDATTGHGSSPREGVDAADAGLAPSPDAQAEGPREDDDITAQPVGQDVDLEETQAEEAQDAETLDDWSPGPSESEAAAYPLLDGFGAGRWCSRSLVRSSA